MAEHTPGPWEWVQDRFWGGYSGIINSQGDEVLFPNTSNDGDTGAAWFEDGLTEANARLIAAAPELLEDAQAYREVARNAITDLYAVMMMATSHPQDIYDFALACRKSHMERLEAIDDRAAIAKAKGEK